jgi:hypothetical protein
VGRARTVLVVEVVKKDLKSVEVVVIDYFYLPYLPMDAGHLNTA